MPVFDWSPDRWNSVSGLNAVCLKMKLGIVGSEAAKFTPATEDLARMIIRRMLTPDVSLVISGACHLGGIDVWAVEEAKQAGKPYKEYTPRDLEWETGYKPRNLLIAHGCDKVVCITVRKLPGGYKGMRLDWCYHCKNGDHVKSGGCWTMKQAAKLGKQTELIII